jgi:UDP-perosamine 4-acetyltransferase
LTGLVVIGTSGHARSCLDILDSIGCAVLGCVGDPPSGLIQADYLGSDEVLAELRTGGVTDAVVGVGDNRARRRLVDELDSLGFRLPPIVSVHAVVSPTASVGRGTVIMHGVVVGPFTSIGVGAIINTAASIDHDCTVGDFAHVAPGTHLAGTIDIGPGSFLGVGVSVVPGVVIGEWSTVGAGAAVVDDVPPRKTVVGVPARELSSS